MTTAVNIALDNVAQCFNRVRFMSAKLSDDQDKYPFGPTNQWYNLFLNTPQFTDKYEYMLWSEPDVFPIRAEWIDALLFEVSFNGHTFFVKGSIHRGKKLGE